TVYRPPRTKKEQSEDCQTLLAQVCAHLCQQRVPRSPEELHRCCFARRYGAIQAAEMAADQPSPKPRGSIFRRALGAPVRLPPGDLCLVEPSLSASRIAPYLRANEQGFHR